MRISYIEVSNFRGIKHGTFSFSSIDRIVCIIGPGDTGKSTLLKSIEWALWPNWNLIASDLDFYKGNTSTPITIEVSVAEFPEEFLNDEKYGLYIRDAEAVVNHSENDEPQDNKDVVLTIRLSIDDSLEPKWEVVSNRQDPKTIGHRDRQLLVLGSIGFDYEKDFIWGKNSILQKYADSKETLHSAYTKVMRDAVEKIELSDLDAASEHVLSAGQQYGVSFQNEIHNKILMQNGSFSTTVGVFDGDVPFIQRGLGSKRLLSMGMHINASDGAAVLLVDEIETGLEPYRICSLISEFRNTHKNVGQIIMTTHSQNAITECSVEEIYVMSSKDGKITLHALYSGDPDVDGSVQSIVRTEPSAFLSRRLIVCEGKT